MGAVEKRVEAVLQRVDAENDRSRIFIETDPGRALAAAREADARPVPLGPLDGLLVGVKANIAVEGLAWSAGIAGWKDRIAKVDAHVVTRLRTAGCIILGTLNMEEGALGAVTDNPSFGRCRNPLDQDRTAGGSSGGSAAALAAGLLDLALGTDTMGSVRIPAAYCGVAGLKPSRGLIARSGLAHLSPGLDCIGPMSQRADLLMPALEVMSGFDDGDPESLCASPLAAMVASDLRGVILAVPHGIESAIADPAVETAFRHGRDTAAALGASLKTVEMSGWDAPAARRSGLLIAEAEGAVEMAELMGREAALSPALHKALAFGRDVASDKLVRACGHIRAAAACASRILAKADAILLPTAPQRAFLHGTPIPVDQADFTALASFHGGPAVAVPVRVPGESLPASIQLVGAALSDARLLSWAGVLQSRLG